MAVVRRHIVETTHIETDLDTNGRLVHQPSGSFGIALGRNTRTNRALVQFQTERGAAAIWIPWERLKVHDAVEVDLDVTET